MNESTKPSEANSVTDRLISLIRTLSEEDQKRLLKVLEDRFPRDRRRHPRKPFPTFVDFACEGRSFREFIRDVSEGGIFIETSVPFSVGKEIVISLSGLSKPLKVTGHIVRVEDAGIGVQFDVNSAIETLSIRSSLKEI